jgi:hypothetical protein
VGRFVAWVSGAGRQSVLALEDFRILSGAGRPAPEEVVGCTQLANSRVGENSIRGDRMGSFCRLDALKIACFSRDVRIATDKIDVRCVLFCALRGSAQFVAEGLSPRRGGASGSRGPKHGLPTIGQRLVQVVKERSAVAVAEEATEAAELARMKAEGGSLPARASHAHHGGIGLDAASGLLICTRTVIADAVADFHKYFWPGGFHHRGTEGTGRIGRSTCLVGDRLRADS